MTVNKLASGYQVIGMKYCYVDGWNQDINVAYNNGYGYYITKMEELERQYPDITFIYATSALWHEPRGSMWINLQLVRKYRSLQ